MNVNVKASCTECDETFTDQQSIFTHIPVTGHPVNAEFYGEKEPPVTPERQREYDEAVAACPEPHWHNTHRYCPVCPWNETGRFLGG